MLFIRRYNTEKRKIGSLSFLHWFFFFSSRRRHTRLTCDWSSDVCSSDLQPLVQLSRARSPAGGLREPDGFHPRRVHAGHGAPAVRVVGLPGHRLLRPDEPLRHSRSEEHTSELQSHVNLVCRLLLEKKK